MIYRQFTFVRLCVCETSYFSVQYLVCCTEQTFVFLVKCFENGHCLCLAFQERYLRQCGGFLLLIKRTSLCHWAQVVQAVNKTVLEKKSPASLWPCLHGCFVSSTWVNELLTLTRFCCPEYIEQTSHPGVRKTERSVEEVKVGNKTVRARQYPWGVVQGLWHAIGLFI